MTSNIIKTLLPKEAIEFIAHQIDSIQARLGHSLDDQISTVSLDRLAEEMGVPVNSITILIDRANQPIISIGGRRFVRKTSWLEVLKLNERIK